MSVSYNDQALASLRKLVDVVERELEASKPTPELAGAWAQVVKVLSLGPAPDLRDCPHCGSPGMRAASRCGRCWSSLVPSV